MSKKVSQDQYLNQHESRILHFKCQAPLHKFYPLRLSLLLVQHLSSLLLIFIDKFDGYSNDIIEIGNWVYDFPHSIGIFHYVCPSESDESFHLVANYGMIRAKEFEITLAILRV